MLSRSEACGKDGGEVKLYNCTCDIDLRKASENEMHYPNLKKYGFSERFEQEASFYEGLYPSRISEQHRYIYKVISEDGELQAEVSGKLHYAAEGTMDFPAVGDWVMIDRTDSRSGNAIIHNVLERKSVFVRQMAGTSGSVGGASSLSRFRLPNQHRRRYEPQSFPEN